MYLDSSLATRRFAIGTECGLFVVEEIVIGITVPPFFMKSSILYLEALIFVQDSPENLFRHINDGTVLCLPTDFI